MLQYLGPATQKSPDKTRTTRAQFTQQRTRNNATRTRESTRERTYNSYTYIIGANMASSSPRPGEAEVRTGVVKLFEERACKISYS